MPQMSPYNWLALFILISLTLLSLVILLNSYFKKKYPTQYKKLKKKINKYWKW